MLIILISIYFKSLDQNYNFIMINIYYNQNNTNININHGNNFTV